MIESENLSYSMKEHQKAVIIWRERIQAFEKSGMSMKAWCQKNQVNVSSFSIWNKRLREINQDADQKSTNNDLVDISSVLNSSVSRIEKTKVPEWRRSIAATIELPRLNVHVYEGASACTLRAIMEAVGNA